MQHQHPGGPLYIRGRGCAPRISKTTAIKLLACKNKCLCPFLSFSMLPSLLQRIHTNMRAVPRLHCTGRKGRPEWVFRSVMKTPINSWYDRIYWASSFLKTKGWLQSYCKNFLVYLCCYIVRRTQSPAKFTFKKRSDLTRQMSSAEHTWAAILNSCFIHFKPRDHETT